MEKSIASAAHLLHLNKMPLKYANMSIPDAIKSKDSVWGKI